MFVAEKVRLFLVISLTDKFTMILHIRKESRNSKILKNKSKDRDSNVSCGGQKTFY